MIEPIFEVQFMATSYGFRPERGCKDALRNVDENLKDGYTYVGQTPICKGTSTAFRMLV
ncbi:MAG: hypothetical protein ACREU0_07300 [Burkholderiales bacterium]